jgi:serine/threonine-protein kinase
VVGIIVVGLIAITSIVAPRIGNKSSDEPAATVVVTPPAPAPPAAAKEDRTMVAVLPFDNQGSADDEYFAEGVTEEITARLASLRNLGVIARTSVEAYKDSRKPVHDIGRELGVDYVLEGTVRWQRGGDVDRVRVTPQLVRVSDGTNVWADVYDEPMTAVFRVQSTIARTVAQKLDVALHEPEQAAMDVAPTDNIEAYDAYLKGMRLKDNWNSERDLRVAAGQFEKAVALDPDFLMAYARLSEVCADMIWFTHDQSEHRVAASKRAAERAMDIDPDDADARWATGWYYYHAKRDLDNALRYLEPVLEERPNSSPALGAVAYVQRRQGRFEEALANLLRAAELSPNDHTLQYSVGETMVYMRRWAEARPYLDRTTELRPEFVFGRMAKVMSYVFEGDILKARREATELSETFGVEEWGGMQAWVEYLLRDFDAYFAFSKDIAPADNNSFYRPRELTDGIVYRIQGNMDAARKSFEVARDDILGKLESGPDDFRYHAAIGVAYAGLGMRQEAVRHADRAIQLLPPAQDALRAGERRRELAVTLILLGDYDEAIDQLEIIMAIPSNFSEYLLKKDPVFDPLRDNPRFKALFSSS